ncbi:2-C-methyl-D-erythritol 2,4-cyclodiphosphate synthase [Zhaonella formicivorans]|uniref:2-C-methyl-D-erythritol 2,4-cyclodiphosphate synthase n=1 Tax=Zhaonella formicivorans TaxID=2528593 RepID=UPI0010CE3A4E|nr:2-C-methyl-D-erythritol 2,4-cyclodiphosphate synthase [Zhaonella formicivorans]
MRVGIGYDVHALVPGRRLVLGGVEIPYELGLAGHSDADVLVHAIMDALLGAAGLGDIGRHFPDSDPRFKGISSLLLLEETAQKITAAGFAVNNIDAVLIAEKPRLATFIGTMQANIARVLQVPEHSVNVKATTTEGLGFTGRGEGIAAQAICSLRYK